MPHLFRTAPSKNRYYSWFEALHTRVDLLLLAPLSESAFAEIEEKVCRCLLSVEKIGNRFDPDSELSQAVEKATMNPVKLSTSLYALLVRCREARIQTGGLFDITVNSPDYYPGMVKEVELTSEGCLRLHRAGIILDLSGILKGYALEQVRTLLHPLNITDAIVNLGNSSILALGNVPTDIPSGHCLTTSGNATVQRRHIRNPLTGTYIEGRGTISVITNDAIDGEVQSIVSFIRQKH